VHTEAIRRGLSRTGDFQFFATLPA
jgi:hypothetical protein